MKIISNYLNNSQFQNTAKEYDLSEYEKLKKPIQIPFVFFHKNQELNKFLKGGITKGFHYSLYGNTLTGKTYFLETLIETNLNEILINKIKILIISTNGTFSYSKIEGMYNKENLKNIKDFIDIIKLRTENEILSLLISLNRIEEIPYSFIFIDNFGSISDKKNSNINNLYIQIENLKKNKNIGIVSIMFKEFNYRIDIKDFKLLKCSDQYFYIMNNDFQLTFFNLDINLKFYNMKKRRYFLKVYNNDGDIVIYFFYLKYFFLIFF